MVIFAVFFGGGLGSVCRYLLGGLVQSRTHTALPAGTLLVNVVGCVAVGLLAGRFIDVPEDQILRAALIAGFCGGFTTFSTFSLEAFRLWTGGRPGAALAYAMASLVLCLAGTAAGYSLGR